MQPTQLDVSIPSYELIVIGLGLVGSSTLYEAAKILNGTGKTMLFDHKPIVLGIEQNALGHKLGSSHGETRITRQAIGEGGDYVSLAIKSQAKLKELQRKTQNKFGNLFHAENTGVFVIGPKHCASIFHCTPGFLQVTQNIAAQQHISHINFANKDELHTHFPQFNFSEHEAGYLENTMGIMNPEACIKAQIYLAKQENAAVHTSEELLSFKKLENGKIQVNTTKGEYLTNKLILTAGAWTANFLPPDLQQHLTVYRQTVFYFEIDEAFHAQYEVGYFHPFIWDLGNDHCVYGFPIMGSDKTTLKIGTETYSQPTSATSVNRNISAEEIKDMYECYIKPNFKGILPICKEAYVCLYTKTPDSQFLVDYIPGFENKVLFASTCSGHGAKHAPAVGEALAQQMIYGYSDDNIMKFKADRLSSATVEKSLKNVPM